MVKRPTIVGISTHVFEFALTNMAVGSKLLKQNRTVPVPVPYKDAHPRQFSPVVPLYNFDYRRDVCEWGTISDNLVKEK